MLNRSYITVLPNKNYPNIMNELTDNLKCGEYIQYGYIKKRDLDKWNSNATIAVKMGQLSPAANSYRHMTVIDAACKRIGDQDTTALFDDEDELIPVYVFVSDLTDIEWRAHLFNRGYVPSRKGVAREGMRINKKTLFGEYGLYFGEELEETENLKKKAEEKKREREIQQQKEAEEERQERTTANITGTVLIILAVILLGLGIGLACNGVEGATWLWLLGLGVGAFGIITIAIAPNTEKEKAEWLEWSKTGGNGEYARFVSITDEEWDLLTPGRQKSIIQAAELDVKRYYKEIFRRAGTNCKMKDIQVTITR